MFVPYNSHAWTKYTLQYSTQRSVLGEKTENPAIISRQLLKVSSVSLKRMDFSPLDFAVMSPIK